MSEIIKPKKERKFLKALGKIGEVLIQELFFKVGSNLIRKIGGKKTLPSILFIFLSLSIFAQFPNTGNKQRLGFQTTGDGLVWRGSISDTASIQPINNQNAWVIIDTINLKFYTFDFTSNVWNLVGGGGSAFTQPVDSLFFNVGVPTNNVDTAKMRWDSDLATVVLGLNDNVPNELGFKNFWLVKNQTGATITKGSLVYANGTVGASGRITVDKFIANGSIDAKYLLGITAHDLTDGEDGYVISFGKIRQINTDTFAAGAILYPSPTVAGVWTDVEPVAPNIDMPIGFCINSSVNNGTIAIRVASGYKLNELHDVGISSPVEKASLYYSGGLWRDTTAALLVSDTASMLTNYLRTGVAASTYLTQSNAASTYLPLTGGTLTGGLTGTTGSFGTIGGNIAWESGDFKIKPYTNYSSENFGIVFNSLSETETMDFYWFGYSEQPRRAFRFIDGSTNSEKMRIEPFTGNVGINQTVPSYKLDVNGTLGVTGATTLSDDLILRTSGGSRFQTAIRHYYEQQSRYAGEIQFLPSGSSGSALTFITNQSGFGQSERMRISETGNIGIGTTNPLSKLEVHGSAVFNEGSADADFRVESIGNANMVFVDASMDRVGIGYASPTKTLDVNGEVRINTVTATPTSLLGKDGSNVVGEVTTVAQTGLMTRGETTATTGSPSAIFTVTHGLGSTPTSVLVTSAGLAGAEKIIFEVYSKNSTTFSVQAWNYDGTEASNKSVKIFWLAIK